VEWAAVGRLIGNRRRPIRNRQPASGAAARTIGRVPVIVPAATPKYI